MKRTLLLVFICVGLLLCAVGYSDSRYRTALGRLAPALVVGNSQGKVFLDSLKGRYVLVNFWNSTDAASREAANRYTAWMRKKLQSAGTKVAFVSVNFDESDKLFEEIVRLDSLIPSQQYHVEGASAKAIRDNYGLEEGYGSLLVDRNGRIVAHNPSAEELDDILR